MYQIIEKSISYIQEVLMTTGYQLFILLGPLALLAVLMNFVANYNESQAMQLFGRKGYLYGFGWLGVSVHELAHAFFAAIFFHKIHEIKLFTPNSENGYLGYVSHAYNRSSLYQTIGCFFIGIGPILLCPLLLILVAYLLFGVNLAEMGASFQFDFTTEVPFFSTDPTAALNSFISFGESITLGQHSSWWKLVLFIYLFFAIGSSVALSKLDVKIALRGFYGFVILLFLLNLATIWYGDVLTYYLDGVSQWMGVFYFVTILALLLNICFMIIMKLITIFR